VTPGDNMDQLISNTAVETVTVDNTDNLPDSSNDVVTGLATNAETDQSSEHVSLNLLD